jgi:UDP-N-acetylglucosamine 4-epimerase
MSDASPIYHLTDLSQYHFLVTGGAGFIGSHLTEYLLSHGAAKVRVIDNFSTGFPDNLSSLQAFSSLEIQQGDIRLEEDCHKACQDIHYVLHQAALGSVPRSLADPLTSHAVNITGFLNMLVAARDAGVKRFVYAASSSTYGDHPGLPKVEAQIGQPLSPYAVTKYVNELYASVFYRHYRLESIGLRYFNVFGPRQNPKGAYAAVIPKFIECLLQGTPPVINGDGETSRDFTYVSNAVQANIRALFAPQEAVNEVFNIAVGERTSLNQMFYILASQLHSPLRPQYGPERAGDVRHSLADISKAQRLLAYHPQVRIEEGLSKTLEWFKTTYSFVPTSDVS